MSIYGRLVLPVLLLSSLFSLCPPSTLLPSQSSSPSSRGGARRRGPASTCPPNHSTMCFASREIIASRLPRRSAFVPPYSVNVRIHVGPASPPRGWLNYGS
ncbi:hypothetical protein P170DRAFT_433727, partial [Aspergillus steynii IBT 23096]